MHASLKNFVYYPSVRSVDVEAGVIIQCGKPEKIGTALDRDYYFFRLVTEVKEEDVYLNDREKLVPKDTNEDPFQVWRWVGGKLNHAGSTDLEWMTKVPSKLDGNYITPQSVRNHNNYHYKTEMNRLGLGGFGFRNAKHRQSFSDDYVYPPTSTIISSILLQCRMTAVLGFLTT